LAEITLERIKTLEALTAKMRGMDARVSNRPLAACPYDAAHMRNAWIKGWQEQNACYEAKAERERASTATSAMPAPKDKQ
jgi:ribosome modulation factor